MPTVASPPLLSLPIDESRPRATVAVAATVVRVLVAGTFVWAAIPKLAHPAGSAAAVRAFELFPEWLVKILGYGLPFLGVGLAVLLAAGLATRLAAVVSAAVVLLFAVGVAAAAARGLEILCGFLDVGGTLPFGTTPPYVAEIVRDDVLLAALVFLAWTGRSRAALDNLVRRHRPGIPPPERRMRLTVILCTAGLAGLLILGCAVQAARVA